MPTTNRRLGKQGFGPVLILLVLFIGGFGWMAFRPMPTAADYQKVTGTVASATEVTPSGGNDFTVRVWLSGQPKVAYKLAATVSGELLGAVRPVPGSTVEMQALTSEIQTPFTGPLHNVDPTIEIAALNVDGKPLSTWEDHRKHMESQKKSSMWIMVGAAVLGLFIWFARKRSEE